MNLIGMVANQLNLLKSMCGVAASSGRARVALCVALGLASTLANAAVPVIPGAVGFGVTTPAGRGGTVYRVTSLSDSGTGSLRACVDASGPRVCVFEVSGYITLNSELTINNPFITIAGQTAPSPGISVRGHGIRVSGDDVLIQHIRSRPGDMTPCGGTCNRDGFKVEGSADRVLLDHVSSAFSIDELMSVWGPRTGVHIQNSLFGWPLHCSTHEKGCHGYGPTFGMKPDGSAGPEVSFTNNIVATAEARMPMVRGKGFIANNLIYNRYYGPQFDTAPGQPLRISVVSNAFLMGPKVSPSNHIRIQGSNFDKASRVYVAGNSQAAQPASGDPEDRAFSVPSDQWGPCKLCGLVQIEAEVLSRWDGTYETAIAAMKVPSQSEAYWVPGFSPRPVGQVYDHTVTHAGARPADRDWIDSQLISDVRNANGRTINCVTLQPSNTKCDSTSEVAYSGSSGDQFGWPRMTVNTRQLTLPSNPGQDDDGDGYTRLEEWLHAMAADVEGGESGTPMPPSGLSVN